MDEVFVKKMIICTKARRGSGKTKLSPVRIIKEVYDFKGNLVAENDCHSISVESLTDFVKYRFKGKEQEQVLEWIWQYFVEDDPD